MLELSLLRHAKSDWGASYSGDSERPLNSRGVRSARAVGEFVANADRVPEVALTSPAIRANQTLELASAAGAWETRIEVVAKLYSGGTEDLLNAIRGVPGSARLLVVGHEPTMSTAISKLIGGGSFRVPTAALVEVLFPVIEWKKVRWGIGELRSFTLARTLFQVGYGSDGPA